MGTGLPITAASLRLPLPQLLQEIPQSVKSYVTQGFAVLARVPVERLGDLLQSTSKALEWPHSQEDDTASAANLGVTGPDLRLLLGACTFLVALVTEREDGPEALAKGLRDGGLLQSDTEAEAARRFVAAAIDGREELKERSRRAQISNAVLPSFDAVHIAVELRFEFDGEGAVEIAVPVAVVHIRTDSRSQLVWFQMSQLQIRSLIRKLERTARELESVQSWFGRKEGE